MQASSLSQLQVFLMVARRKSFSGAARELGVSTSAVSQAVRQLEAQTGVVLLTRTTRSVSLTAAGERLLDGAGPALSQALASLAEVATAPGEVSGRVRLTVPRAAVEMVLVPLLPVFRERHPRVEIEVTVEDRMVDIVANRYDAGIRLTEAIQRDMVQVRLTDPFRFVVVGSPAYLKRAGTPQRPEELLRHQCITFRSQTTGALYAWELERGRRNWRVPVRGGLVTNDILMHIALAEAGQGLIYGFEPMLAETIRKKRLVRVLEPYAATVPGFFLYFPSRAQRSPALRLLVETAREVLGVRAPPTRASDG